jgi:hypothetical protein
MRWFTLATDLLLAAFGVWILLTAYRVVGKPPGTDEKHDARHRQWGPTRKVIGWLVVVVAGFGLVVSLFW